MPLYTNTLYPVLLSALVGIAASVASADVYVSASRGSNAFPGTPELPVQTISHALSLAAPGETIRVARGTYDESIRLTDRTNIDLIGGYEDVNWTQNDTLYPTYVTGGSTAVLVDRCTGVDIRALNIIASSGFSSYAMLIRDSNTCTVTYCTLTAGRGHNGSNGSAGASGRDGGSGHIGGHGNERSNGLCERMGRPLGGAGGSSPVGNSGGRGGDAGLGSEHGFPGSSTGSAIGGAPSGPGRGNVEPFSWQVGQNGQSSNSIGANGTAGVAFSSSSLTPQGFSPASGTAGGQGGHGFGGAGGGGGGGGIRFCNSHGSAGGGGGGGGEGGYGGGGGRGGGGSFGVYIFGSNNCHIEHNQIYVRSGGRGGSGAFGGQGGLGGAPGATSNTGAWTLPNLGQLELGATPTPPSLSYFGSYYGRDSRQDDGSMGGRGGFGGSGAPGGRGGAGAGGPSIGLISTGGTVTQANNNVTFLEPVAQGGEPGGVAGYQAAIVGDFPVALQAFSISQSFAPGLPVTFSVQAVGPDAYGTFSYEWELDGDECGDDAVGPNVSYTYPTAGTRRGFVQVRSSTQGIVLIERFEVTVDGEEPCKRAWSTLPTNGPGPRMNHIFVYDEANQRSILCGGNGSNVADDVWSYTATGGWTRLQEDSNISIGKYSLFGAVGIYNSAEQAVQVLGGSSNGYNRGLWQLVGNQWQLRSTDAPVLMYAAGAYDPIRQRIVVFGGASELGPISGDTYEYDGESWTLAATSGPVPCVDAKMAFDANLGTVVLYGGHAAPSQFMSWNGVEWSPIDAGPVTPGPRTGHTLVFDSTRQRLVLNCGYGPSISRETWEFDGEAWSLTSMQPQEDAVYNHAATFDSSTGKVLAFGGYNITGTYRTALREYDGTQWTNISSITGPQYVKNAALVYDSRRDVTVMFGGNTPWGGPSFETWEFNADNSWRRSADIPLSFLDGHAVAYDPVRGVVVVLGGLKTNNSQYPWYGPSAEIWEYNGESWILSPYTLPYAIDYASAVFDSARGAVVMYGGRATSLFNSNQSWRSQTLYSLDANGVSVITPVGGESPDSGGAGDLVYDPIENRLLWVGIPWPDFSRTIVYEFKNDTWTLLASLNTTPSPCMSSQTTSALPALFDPLSSKLALFGSGCWTSFNGTDFNDVFDPVLGRDCRGYSDVGTKNTVAYDSARQRFLHFGYEFGDPYVYSGFIPRMFSYASVTAGVAPPADVLVIDGQTATLSVTMTGSGTIQWYRDGEALTVSDRINGATSTVLTIDDVSSDDIGYYYVHVTDRCGQSTSQSALLDVLCPADYNRDGGINGDDVGAFFQDWQNGDALSDVNADGGIDGSDIDTFFTLWEAGGC